MTTFGGTLSITNEKILFQELVKELFDTKGDCNCLLDLLEGCHDETIELFQEMTGDEKDYAVERLREHYGAGWKP